MDEQSFNSDLCYFYLVANGTFLAQIWTVQDTILKLVEMILTGLCGRSGRLVGSGEVKR